MRSALGLNDSNRDANPGIPITCNGMELSDSPSAAAKPMHRAATVLPAPVPAPVPALVPSPVPAPSNLAYASAEDSVPLPPPPKEINTFGEFDGKVRASATSTEQANFQQHTFVSEGFDGDVSVDPTGHWLTFTSTRHNVHPQIYLQRVDGTSVIQLTSDNADYSFPTFSPDGKQIAFSSTRAGNWDIYVMDTDGRNVVQVTNSPAQELHPSFSPDGRRLVYCSMGPRSKLWELWTADAQSSEHRMIGQGLFPSWSPAKDKDQIAFQRARQRGSRWFSLWTLDLVNGEARNVTEVAVSANAAIVSPSWSPDGGKLAFSTIVDPSAADAHGKPQGPQDIWTVNADGSNRQRLTDGNGVNTTPFWSRDNRVFFVSNRSGVECVWSAQSPSADAPMAKSPDQSPAKSAIGSTDTHESN
jgi:TolB protein